MTKRRTPEPHAGTVPLPCWDIPPSSTNKTPYLKKVHGLCNFVWSVILRNVPQYFISYAFGQDVPERLASVALNCDIGIGFHRSFQASQTLIKVPRYNHDYYY